MNKKISIIAVVGALAGVAALPAGASAACLKDPTVPDCVNEAITAGENAVATAEGIYTNTVQPEVNAVACIALHVLTGRC